MTYLQDYYLHSKYLLSRSDFQGINADFTRKTFDVSRKSLFIWQGILVKLFLHMVYKECYFHIVLCTTYFYTLIKEWAAGFGDGKEKEGIYRCHH